MTMMLLNFQQLLIIQLTFITFVHNVDDHTYWLNLGKGDIKTALNVDHINHPAKNVVVFMGDGMGPTTVTAARIYAKTETGYLSFEQFPHIAALKTYSADKLVPDSCSTATALFCGIKANYKTSGVDSTVTVNDCEASLRPGAQIDSVIKWAQQVGKATGFVTTTRVTHATPSALYAHVPNRKWECESAMPAQAAKCKDIGRQLVEDEPGKSINVVMGGGRQCLQTNIIDSGADPIDTWSCRRKDNRDLIDVWVNDKKNRRASYAVVSNNQELAKVDPSTDFVLGVFANGHMKMDHARDRSPVGMPSLMNMTDKALEILSKNPNGFLLIVEGGLIDYAHHRGHAKQALDETAAFNNAIESALKILDLTETLVIVTSDHAHSLVLTGYPDRGTSITGIAGNSVIDSVPYTSLLYGTGGLNNYQFTSVDGKIVRPDPSKQDLENFEYSQQAAILTDEVTHGGTDVLVYAKGPMAHLFHSVHEQTYVAYVIGYAMEIGPFTNNGSRNFNTVFIGYWLIILANFIIQIIILF